MIKATRIALTVLLCMAPTMGQAREQIRIVGSSTVFPFVAAAAEQFGRAGKFRTPIVEATGTGGGIKMFCDGIGDGYADIANASRQIKASEIELCAKHGITSITELKIGYDGIVLANARSSPSYALTRQNLFLALARQVPVNGTLVNNPYKRWSDIDPALPKVAIEVYGPPPSSGTRDAFTELVMLDGCKLVPELVKLLPDEKARKQQCGAIREDGVFKEAGEDDNLIVQKLINNPDALGVFGYSFLESNAAKVKANAVDGVMPDYDAIESGTYHVARSLFVYIKNAHADTVPGLHEFARELTSNAASGDDGYLVVKGLLPLGDDDHELMKARAKDLTPLKP
ncbi:MAG: PstS family phosphate ABC transporter substrate-binding protein [Rickettsiales bacterium]|nr:PstS family phosphate ABC transporter substrate-binding protein [Rickettsiales bacterium]